MTLPLRLDRQCATAATGADFLARDARVAHVAYPGLPEHPGHALAAAQFGGWYGGVISFALAGAHADRLRFVDDLRLITSAVPLGHDETLIVYETYPGRSAEASAQPFRDHGLIHLAVGLEAPEDLVADLDAALTTAYFAAP